MTPATGRGKCPLEKAGCRSNARQPYVDGRCIKKLLPPDSKRKSVNYLQEEYGCSQRRACKVLSVKRMTTRRKKGPGKDDALRKRIRALEEERKRFGASRLHVLLKQEGLVANDKRTERIYS